MLFATDTKFAPMDPGLLFGTCGMMNPAKFGFQDDDSFLAVAFCPHAKHEEEAGTQQYVGVGFLAVQVAQQC